MNKSIAIVILAAGSSSRLGRPKQLLTINQLPMLQKTWLAAAEVCENVSVVLGANESTIRSVIPSADSVVNENWHSGMASSIQVGVSHALSRYPDTQAIIISVCDQPGLTSKIFTDLIHAYNYFANRIVAAAYRQTVGVPVLFDRSYFHLLQTLQGDAGAKALVNQFSSHVVSVEFSEGHFDIDTEDDYNTYLGNANS